MVSVCTVGIVVTILAIGTVVSIFPIGGVVPILSVCGTVSRGYSDKVMLERVHDQLETARDLQLVKDGCQMMSDGGLGDKKLVGNILVLEPLTDQLYNLPFPISKIVIS
jgi:hypothetical protein